MANIFTNASSESVGTILTDVYTVPAGVQAVVHAVYLSNVLGTTINVNLLVDTTNVLSNIEMLASSSIVLNKPINLKAGQVLKVRSSADVSLDIFCSILEVS